MELTGKYVDTAAALRWIVERGYGPRTKLDAGPLPILVGKEVIGDDDYCAAGVVTVTRKGIHYWIRDQDHDRGPNPIVSHPINGLCDFMSNVMWSRVGRDWNDDRLMAETDWTAQERAAIDAWEISKAKLRRLIHRDHDKGMRVYPALHELYLALHALDVPKLRQYNRKLRGHVGKIGSEEIQILAQAIEDGDRALVLSQKKYLIFRAVIIAFVDRLNVDAISDEQSASLSATLALHRVVIDLARRRYTAQFLDFCLSPEMLDIKDQYFAESPEGNRAAYCAQVSAFAGGKLDMIDDKAFYK